MSIVLDQSTGSFGYKQDNSSKDLANSPYVKEMMHMTNGRLTKKSAHNMIESIKSKQGIAVFEFITKIGNSQKEQS